MVSALAKRFFGSANDRLVKGFARDVELINAYEESMQALSDDELRAKTDEFIQRLEAGETENDLLHEAFAVVREASIRTLGMRHFDVQLIGGMVLHRGLISEMKTGEGKTLVATLPAYLNAISGKGVHIVTVNDYLAERDATWMGHIYEFLGLKVGIIKNDLDDDERQEAYRCDITYATNNELGFDYLRDNMKYSREEMVQRPHHYAIVDEVDSILIDEARTPLIISGPTEDNSELYIAVNRYIPQIPEEHLEVDEKTKSVTLNEDGVAAIEEKLQQAEVINPESSLYDIDNVSVVHHLNQALRAHKMFSKDVDYIVKDNKVIIIDEFTGRMMEGRRYSDGLHQALEAKEHVSIQNENQTLASITFQNYFRLYPKLAGMTGTAMTEAAEFNDIYGLDVVEIPTNVPVARDDQDDWIYRTMRERDDAAIELIAECHKRKQPVLVGTISIEKSEAFSKTLKKAKIPHSVLNARHHEKEAHIIAQAGRPGAVTIATNMAGRGTDIQLGGNVEMRIAEETASLTDESKRNAAIEKIKQEVARDKELVKDAGGLFVISTERHESRRIDNQLRGRSGRQGDPGASRFFISLEDDLMRIFGSERIESMLSKLGMQEGEAINHPWMNKAIERAQAKVEQRNYEIRKNLLKFDDVMNDQRKAIFEQRIELMEAEDVSEELEDMRDDVNEGIVGAHIPPRSMPEQWDADSLEKDVFRIYGIELPVTQWADEEGIADEEILERIDKAVDEHFAKKREAFEPELYKVAQKRVLLQTLDQLWKDHLLSLDHLRQGIGLRAYGQRDPLNEYKQEAFSLFEHMLHQMREVVTMRMAHLQIRVESPEELMQMQQQQQMQEGRVDPALADEMQQPVETVHNRVKAEDRDPNNPATWGKVARNEPCPCGSGKKYKQCHGKIV
ncbi:MAG: preprotein translocase subunit SecA [Rickettsiales bacterium]|nr:preprotein translocase subunit SecA [Rickettsiales bacterium]